jgi:RimJ/RimL family protein N-acetyltransferase
MRHMTALGRTCAPPAAAGESLITADGAQISLRQVGADDRAAMAAFFDRLSPRSRHRRFLSSKRELTPRELTYFTDIDHHNHEAIAAVDLRDGSIVGVARYVQYADRAGVAEVAIEVADAFQQMGIGTALAGLTIERADANGVTLLIGTTLWENRAARGLLRHLGFRARRSRGSEIEHELKLAEPSPREALCVPANPRLIARASPLPLREILHPIEKSRN